MEKRHQVSVTQLYVLPMQKMSRLIFFLAGHLSGHGEKVLAYTASTLLGVPIPEQIYVAQIVIMDNAMFQYRSSQKCVK